MATATQTGKIELRGDDVYRDGKLVGRKDANGDIWRGGKKVGHLNLTRKPRLKTPASVASVATQTTTTAKSAPPKKKGLTLARVLIVSATVIFGLVLVVPAVVGVTYFAYIRNTSPNTQATAPANTPADATSGANVVGRLNVDYTLNGQVDMSESDPTSGHATVDVWIKGRVRAGEKYELVFVKNENTPLSKGQQVAIIAKGLVGDEEEQVVHPLFSVEFNTSRPGAYFALRDYKTGQLVSKKTIKLPS